MPVTTIDDLAHRTQRYDVLRSIPAGLVQPFEGSVLLTILAFHFAAPGWAKATVAAAAGVGLLLSPVVTEHARRGSLSAMRSAAVVSCIGAAGCLVAVTGSLILFVIGSVLAVGAASGAVPLQTATYQRNFSAEDRGRRVSRGLAVRVGVSAVSGYAMGELLKHRIDLWWVLPVGGVIAYLAAAGAQWQTPSAALDPVDHSSFLPHFHLLAEDAQLRLTLSSWMVMGIGNLMLLPLRLEYLTLPEYGIEADPAEVTALMLVIPAVTRLVVLPLFGRLFDRVSFFSARILVNVLFTMYIVAFFAGTSPAGLVLGAVLLGVGSAGGDLLWSLWVIKFAPDDRVADYMGLHTFSTGLRAVAAPFVGYALIEVVDIPLLAAAAGTLIVLASVMLVPQARLERRPAS